MILSLGIDPGRSTGLALYDGRRITWSARYRVDDDHPLSACVAALPAIPCVVGLELQHAAPRAGLQSVLTLGSIRGRWYEAILAGLGIVPLMCQPAEWQCGVLGVGRASKRDERKRAAGIVARGLGMGEHVSEDEADAAGIAVWAWQEERYRR